MKKPPASLPQPPRPERRPGLLRRLLAKDAREHAWAFLNYLDARPALKKSLLYGLPVLVAVAAAGGWAYGRWTRGNAVSITRQWLAAGKLDRAAAAVQDALAAEPGEPAPLRLASEIAWQTGNRAAAIEYAQKAAEAGHYQAGDVLAWAGAALLSGEDAEARKASTFLKPDVVKTSAPALRFFGELARRDKRFAEARDRFGEALRIDADDKAATLAVDEIPLGIACLETGDAADRARGLALLTKWAGDVNWGVAALRALIADAMEHGDRPAAGRWADALRAHPRCTLGDVPTCLNALFFSDPARYRAALAILEKGRETQPVAAGELIGWLNQIGRGEDAIAWIGTLAPSIRGAAPVAQGQAEALRATGRWADLRAAVGQADWGADMEFLRWTYGMAAARKLGDAATADSFWKGLYGEGQMNAAHALLAGDLLYAWGYPQEAADLLWLATRQGDFAYQALGSLVRLYQVAGDSVGQFRAFERLNAIRPDDRGIANNYVYFAALTGMGDPSRIGQMARDLFEREPGNATYRCTYAFVLACQGDPGQAMRIIQPEASTWKTSPAVAFAYGAALAGVGRKPEAKAVFATLDPGTLDARERQWIEAALR